MFDAVILEPRSTGCVGLPRLLLALRVRLRYFAGQQRFFLPIDLSFKTFHAGMEE